MSDPMRRKVLFGVLAGYAGGAVSGVGGYRIWRSLAGPRPAFNDLLAEVLPREGIPTGLVFGDSLQRLTAAKMLMPGKLRDVYAKRGGLPPWVESLLNSPSDIAIHFDAEAAQHLLNLLWAVGLATRTPFNEKSPTNGAHLPRLASTAGWKMGQEPNGAAYFNKVDTLALTSAQAAMVRQVAEGTYRPCCDNSALFQDCNHGSAMLGLLELAASQGREKPELERIALAANSFWFPGEYLKTALFFSLIEQRNWKDVPPADILSAKYSSASGWQATVNVGLQLTSLISRESLIRMNRSLCRL